MLAHQLCKTIERAIEVKVSFSARFDIVPKSISARVGRRCCPLIWFSATNVFVVLGTFMGCLLNGQMLSESDQKQIHVFWRALTFWIFNWTLLIKVPLWSWYAVDLTWDRRWPVNLVTAGKARRANLHYRKNIEIIWVEKYEHHEYERTYFDILVFLFLFYLTEQIYDFFVQSTESFECNINR